MSTTYTPAEAKVALLAVMTSALDPVPCFYAWEPDATDRCAFLGRPRLSDTDDVLGRTTITTTRKFAEVVGPSDAVYIVEGTCWSHRPDLTPADAATAEADVDAMWTSLRSAFAALSWVGDHTVEYQLREFQSGWAAHAPFTVEIKSLLS